MLPICYNGFVRSARFFLLPAVALAEEGALPPMLARHVVPLTPLVSVRPIHSVSSKQCADESPQIPFFVFKNLRTLSFSVSCNSFICHYYEDCWVCTNNSHSGTHLPDHDDHPCCFFSNTYEMQISQLLCFDIHANWGGCVHPGGSILQTRHSHEGEESRPSASCLRYFLTSLLHYFLLPLQSLHFHPGEK